MTDKQKALDTIANLPEQASMAEIAEEMEILAAIRRGEQAADAGKTTPHEGSQKVDCLMDCKIVWTDAALADLRDIIGYISADNPEAGRRVGMDIYETVGLLASFPLIGPAYPRGSKGRIREIVCWSYRIF